MKGYDERHIPTSIFRQQLGYLSQKGYSFITMSEMLDVIKNRKRIKRPIVLTFDDGFMNIVRNAYPVMKDFNARGCFYLVSDLIGTDRLLWTDYVESVIRNQKPGWFQFIFNGEAVIYNLDDRQSYNYAMKDIKAKLRIISDKERYEHLKQFDDSIQDNVSTEFSLADWEQIKKLDPGVLEIGSHTKRHPDCAKLTSDTEIEDEIFQSKIDIEKQVGYTINHFCYPAGSYNDRIIAKVKEYGYQSAVTIEYGFNDAESNVYRLKRMGVTESYVLFKANVSGSYNFLRKIKAAFS